jgi:hypothetical protein
MKTRPAQDKATENSRRSEQGWLKMPAMWALR